MINAFYRTQDQDNNYCL